MVRVTVMVVAGVAVRMAASPVHMRVAIAVRVAIVVRVAIAVRRAVVVRVAVVVPVPGTGHGDLSFAAHQCTPHSVPDPRRSRQRA